MGSGSSNKKESNTKKEDSKVETPEKAEQADAKYFAYCIPKAQQTLFDFGANPADLEMEREWKQKRK